MKKLAHLVALVLLLAGCAAPAEEQEDIMKPEEESATVAVRWNTWEPEEDEPAVSDVRRWYETYTDELIPSEDYGELIPYIGGESYNEIWGSGYRYGLATLDGVIVTDAVFLNADLQWFYDDSGSGKKRLPVFLLSRAEELPDGTTRQEYALAASDGSWYTGMKYCNHIATTDYGVLMTEKEGDVVLVGPEGEEVFRWGGEMMPIEGFQWSAAWQDGLIFLRGEYLLYEIDWTDEGARYAYIHLPTGFVYWEPPDDVPPLVSWDDSDISFNGGTYHYNAEWVTIETVGGETYRVSLDGYSVYKVADGKVFMGRHLEDSTWCMVKDFYGNTVMEPYDEHELSVVYQYRGGPMMLYWSDYESTGGVMDAEGNLVAEPVGFTLTQYGDRLIFMDETAYRVTDLEGSDILRLPRYNWDD